MSLSEFLDVALAIHVREAVRVGLPLEEALEKHMAWSRLTLSEGVPTADARSVAAQNERALAQLDSMMGGVG